MAQLTRWGQLGVITQTTLAACVYLTVRWLVKYGLMLEGKPTSWFRDEYELNVWERKHQGGCYNSVIDHFTKAGVGCCHEMDLQGSLDRGYFANCADAKSKIIAQIQSGLPVAFTLHAANGGDYHSYIVVEADDNLLTFLNPANPPRVETKDWAWFCLEWAKMNNGGGKELAWYQPPLPSTPVPTWPPNYSYNTKPKDAN